MACNYSSKFIPLIESKANEYRSKGDEIGLQKWFTNSFNDGLNIYTRYTNGALYSEKSTVPTAKVVNRPYWGRFTQDVEYNAVSDYFKGADDLQVQSEHEFKKQIVKRLIFDINTDVAKERWKHPDSVDTETGVSTVNKVIAEYKQDLCNNILSEVEPDSKIVLDHTLTDSQFNAIVQDVLAKYRQFLTTNPDKAVAYNDFVTLSLFDQYLKQHAPFITPKSEFINKVTNQLISTDSFDKYEYHGPNVKHYTGYQSSEFAAIENQDSDLAKLLLDTIPDLNEDGSPIPGSFIGLSGFNAAMSAMKNWILYDNSEEAQKARKEYRNGSAADIEWIIDQYLLRNKKVNNTVTNIYSDRTTFLNGKLKSIAHYLFNSGADSTIEAMFANMFFKTEPISYRTYSYDTDKGQIVGSNLRSSFINAQKFNVEDIVRSVTYLTRTSPSHKANLNALYNIIYNKDGSVTITNKNDYNEYVTIRLNKGADKYVKGSFDGPGNTEFKKNVIKDFLMFIVPDTYEQVGKSMEKDDWDWTQDFAPFVGIVAYSALKQRVNHNAISFKNNLVNLKDYTDSTLRIAKKLSVIYGSETKNVVKNLSGSNLPLYQLTNLSYNLPIVIDDVLEKVSAYKDATANDPNHEFDKIANENNLFIQARELLIAPQVRQEVQYGNLTKPASKLTVKELLQLNVFHDFYEGFTAANKTDEEHGKIYLQSATYADKSTHYLFGYNLDQTVLLNGERINLFNTIKDIIDGKTDSSKLLEITRKIRASRINNIVSNIISDYNIVFETSLKTITDLQNFLKGKDYNDIVSEFKKAGIEFLDEFHGTKPKYAGAPSIALNETMVNYYNTFNSPELFKQRINKARESFINSIDSNYWTWNKYDSPIFDKLYGEKRYEAFKDVNGKINTHIGSTLHPILEAYFLTDVLFSNEINSLLIGEVWAHPNKNKRTTNLIGTENYDENEEDGTYEEFSEANRLIAQIKRSVAFGATYHPYIQNLANGVAPEIRIAVIEDIPGTVFTPNGDEKTDLDSSDGSGIAHPLQSRFENNSLVDARVGANKKSIMMDVDPYYGRPTLLKWAVYELSNENRRNGILSRANLENIYKKMSDNIISCDDYSLNHFVENRNVYYKDYKSGKYYKIIAFDYTDENDSYSTNDYYEVTRYKIEIDPNTLETIGSTISEVIDATTLYDVDQALGGAWVGEFKNGQWEYNEAQLDYLENYISDEYSPEDKTDLFIGYLVNKSAIKVGAGNINKTSAWNDNTEFDTITMQTKYGGVQMDADHELDMAEVTEMTQMISALIEDGHYKDIVDSIYQDIGGVVASHVAKLSTAVNEVLQTGSPEAKQKLYEILAKSWIASFENKSKDTIGIAQAFVKKASDAFRKGDFNTKVPFSAATINGSFVADVIASINKGGIRHKYEGFAGVLNPSHDMIQYFKVYNNGKWEVRMFDDLMKFVKQNETWGITFDNINDIFVENVLEGTQLNPLLHEVTPNEIDFEDTVVILNPYEDLDGNEHFDVINSNDGLEPQFWYINSFTTYDNLKTLLREHPEYKAYIHTGKPRNLKATNTKFTINGYQYSIYDLDSVRASQYLTRVLTDKKKRPINVLLNQNQINLIKKVLGWRFNVQTILENPNSTKFLLANAIKLCNNKTENILKKIESGQAFEASEAFEPHNAIFDENGMIIQRDALHDALYELGTKKDIDVDTLTRQLQDPSVVENHQTVAQWLLNVLQDVNELSKAPITLSDSIKTDIAKAITLQKEADRLKAKYQQYNEGKISDIAKALTDARDAVNDVVDRICNNLFDIDVNWVVRRISNAEPKQSFYVTANDYNVEAAEIITGRYQWEKFNLGQNDNIFDVTDPTYFYDRLTAKYNTLPEYTESTLFDGVLFGNNEQFLFRIGPMPGEYTGNLSESTDFRVLEGDVYYQGEKVCSAENKKFYTYIDETGGKHHIIQLNTTDDLKELKKSSLFDNVVRYNWTQDNFDVLLALKYEGDDEAKIYVTPDKTIIKPIDELTLNDLWLDEVLRLDRRIHRQAKDMYDSFKTQLNYVGARIPTQAMQSFMAMKLVAVTNATENVVYVPKSQTYLEGSDYDIDKLYIMAYSVNPNGLVQMGTSIQSKYGLDFVSKLSRPEGKDIQFVTAPEGATTLNQNFIEQFDFNNLENSEILEVYNDILKTGKIYLEPYVNDGMITLKHYQRVANTILKEIDSYSKSVLTSKSDPNYLKNRVVSGIWAITNKLQNQLISQIPVDMGDPQKAAEQSTLGKAELHINSDDPSAKMMMQQQNAVGKEVIGISAVSLKAFFGLYYYYSELTDNLKQACINNNTTEIVKAIDKLVFVHPTTGKLTSLANIDIEQVIDVIRNNPELKRIDLNKNDFYLSLWDKGYYDQFINKKTGEFELLNFCKYLRDEVNLTDAALTDSAVISAATDNAKELILAKINATPELVDIYTYLTAVGTPFLDIADFMTCESFGFITKAGEVNIFDESSHRRKVKTALDWFLGKELLPGADTNVLSHLFGLSGYDENGVWKHASKDAIIKVIKERNKVETAIKRAYSELGSSYSNNDEQSDITRFSKADIRKAINVLEWQLRAFDFKNKLKDPVKELSKLEKISSLLPNVKEMSTMGQAQGINQGQRTNLYANRAFMKRLSDHVNDMFEQNDIKETFDFDRFVNDENYRQKMIDTYGVIKKSFNILDALTSLPHFWEMLKTTTVSKAAIKESSWRSKTIWDLADLIEAQNAWLSEDDWKTLDNYLSDYIIGSFLKQTGFKFIIPKGTTYYSGMSMQGKLINKVDGYQISLDSVTGVASFKRLVEDVIIPSLKTNIQFAGNRFINNLIPYANISGDRIITGWKLPLDMMNIDASPNTKLLFANILSDFDSISNQSVYGMKLGDIFYLYNLIVNKDGYGKSSLTRLFENTINSDDTTSLAYQFNEFISKLDAGEIELNPDYDEATYRIKKMNPNSYIKSNLNSYFVAPSDFTLDLPKFFELPIKTGINVGSTEMSQRTIDTGTSDMVYAIAQAIADKYDNAVSIVTDEELVGKPDTIRNAKAFIQDGKVFININSATAADALHELAHLVLASMKFSDDAMIRQTYYNLVSTMSDRSVISEERFNAIANAYLEEDGVVTSDILEEVLANELAFYLNGEMLGETPKLVTTIVETNILKALGEVLELDKAPLLSDVQGKTLTEVMQALGRNILNINSIDKDAIIRTQKVSTLEDMARKKKTLTCR